MFVVVVLHVSDVLFDCVEICNEDGSVEFFETYVCGRLIVGRV